MGENHATDQALARRCSEGDAQALAEAVTRHLPSLLRYARSRCDGELAAAEILVRAIQLAGKDFRSCSEAKSLLAWLMRSVHISCSDVQRGPPRDPTGS